MTDSGAKTTRAEWPTETTNDRRLIAWCARKDAQCGIGDDPRVAMEGWRKASEHASQHVGPDPLVETMNRIGIDAAARIYQEEIGAALGEARAQRRAQSS